MSQPETIIELDDALRAKRDDLPECSVEGCENKGFFVVKAIRPTSIVHFFICGHHRIYFFPVLTQISSEQLKASDAAFLKAVGSA